MADKRFLDQLISCACFAGYITLSTLDTGTYTFVLESDDGSMLYIDGKVIASSPGEPASNLGLQ